MRYTIDSRSEGLNMKTKLTNKHGFTLIELLAVISILAVLMLIASGSVISQVNNAQKRAFIIDVNNVVENAKAAYMDSLLNGKLTGNDFCMSLDYLKGKYIDKIGPTYVGSVRISVTNGVATYKVWLSDEKHQINNVELKDVNDENVSTYTAAASTNCGGQGTPVTR